MFSSLDPSSFWPKKRLSEVSPVGLSARVVFIDGLSTLRIKKLRVRRGAAVRFFPN
jgi:hypothetical protein